MKELITFTNLGGLIAFGILAWYAYNVWTRKVPASTPASWLMWTILDSLLLLTTLANHQPGWLPGAWTVGATMVTIALFVRGKWSWSYKETICAIGVAITACVWLNYGSLIGLLAGIAAMNIAGMPITIDLWRNPIRGTWPVWGFTTIACICTLLGSDWSFAGIILAISSTAYNGLMTAIVLCRKPAMATA